jgi:iron complex outermembrane recepter protein
MRGWMLSSTIVLALLSAATHARADDTNESDNTQAAGVETIVVTAEKRAESIQSVPMAITAFTSRTLVQSGITSFQDYAVQVPNLAFSYSGSIAAQSQAIAIRGVFGRDTTGMYIDDTPLPESVDPRVLDLSRIEVLRGPQGTLYGARSMGGTVRLITNLPSTDSVEGFVHAVGSGTEHGGGNWTADGAVNIPLINDVLAVRINGYDDFESGVFDRIASPGAPVDYGVHKHIGSSHHIGGSVTALVKLLDQKLTIMPRVMYEGMSENGHPYADYSAGNYTQYRLFDINEPGTDAWTLYSLTANYELPFGTVTSNTSQFVRRSGDFEDDTEVAQLFFGPPPIPLRYQEHDHYRAFSQEVRFASGFSGPFQITNGLFYQKSDDHFTFPPTPYGDLIDNLYNLDQKMQVSEVAVFGEGTYDLTDALRLIAGVRWFDNEVRFDATQGGFAAVPGTTLGTQKESGINPKFGVQYKFNSQDMVYATAAKGFRIGGVNAYSTSLCAGDLASFGLTDAQARTFRSDSLWSYELGAKTSWSDARVTVNGALFDIEWSDVQQHAALPNCGFAITVNGGHARSQGGELEVQFVPTDSLTLSLGAGYADAHITNPGIEHIVSTGMPIQQIPKWNFNASADYHFLAVALPAFVHADFAYVDSSLSANNSIAYPLVRPAYSLFNIRTGVTIDDVELTFFADNVFDERANLADPPPAGIELPGRPRIVTNRPRTLGLDARLTF